MPKIKTYDLINSLSTTTKMVATNVGGIPADTTVNVSTEQIINMVGKHGVFTGTLAIPAYADEAAALAGGLATGKLFQTTGTAAAPLNVAGIIMIKQ